MGEKEEGKDRKIAELERKLADREREIRQLLRRIERLERKNEALSRAAKRQAAARIGPHGLMVAIGQIEAEFDRLLHRCPRHPSCRRLMGHLRREREAMFTFLHCDAIPASNFLAEQAIRPAVVNRKMSGGNNTLAGARTQEVLMTVLHTGRKRGIDFLTVATNALRDASSTGSMFLER